MKILSSKQWDELNNNLQNYKATMLRQQQELDSIYDVVDIHKSIPQLDEILDVIKYMTPIMREKIVDYLSYYALSLAQDSMYSENLDDIKFKR
jgi:hypothetical protein